MKAKKSLSGQLAFDFKMPIGQRIRQQHLWQIAEEVGVIKQYLRHQTRRVSQKGVTEGEVHQKVDPVRVD